MVKLRVPNEVQIVIGQPQRMTGMTSMLSVDQQVAQ